jgi:hypothetical protein
MPRKPLMDELYDDTSYESAEDIQEDVLRSNQHVDILEELDVSELPDAFDEVLGG